MHSVKISFFYTNIFLKRERPEMDDFEEEKNLFVKEKCQYFQEYLRMQVFLLPYFFRQKPMQKSFLSSF